MRISAKGRYALAAMTSMVQDHAEKSVVTVIHTANKLGISKIYLEQVFSVLKKAGLVTASKGAQGGYQLARMPEKISCYEILSAIETSLFEQPAETTPEKGAGIEAAMRACVFRPLEASIQSTLEKISLADLAFEAEKRGDNQDFMFYI